MKNSTLYPYYVFYIKSKPVSNGIKSLLLLSSNYYLEFCLRIYNDIWFKEKIDKAYLEYNRNKKIEDILDD